MQNNYEQLVQRQHNFINALKETWIQNIAKRIDVAFSISGTQSQKPSWSVRLGYHLR